MEPVWIMVQTFPTSLPVLTLQAGRKAPLSVSYLICQGTETQEPVLSLLQGGGEFTVAELQGLGRLSDLAQVTGAQVVQVVVQVGGGGRLLDITQGLAVTDRQTACARRAGARRSPRPRCRQARTHVCTGPPNGPHTLSLPAGCGVCPGCLLQPSPPGNLLQPYWPVCLLL